MILNSTKIRLNLISLISKISILSILTLSGCVNKNLSTTHEKIQTSPIQKPTESISETIIPIIPENKIEVGILLPMSGKETLTGERLAMYIKSGMKDVQNNLSISLYDGRDADSIKNYSSEILDKNTKLILGPISSDKIPSTELCLKEDSLAVTLSNDLSKKSKNIILFGHEPLKQSEKLFSYLISEKISPNIVLFLSEDDSATTRIENLKDIIKKNHGKCVLVKTYNNENPENLKEIKKSLEQIRELAKKANESSANLGKLGIYISDSGTNLENIINAIDEVGLDKIAHIIGDNRLEKFKIDSIFTTSMNYKNMELDQEIEPENMDYKDKLSYDIGLLVKHFIEEELSLDDLRNTDRWYKGLSGYFKIVNGVVKRQYDIVRRRNNNINILHESKQ